LQPSSHKARGQSGDQAPDWPCIMERLEGGARPMAPQRRSIAVEP
jgi:hypothetical protein